MKSYRPEIQKDVQHLKYGTSCFDSRELLGLAVTAEGAGLGLFGGEGSLGSSVNREAGGRLKLELVGKKTTSDHERLEQQGHQEGEKKK